VDHLFFFLLAVAAFFTVGILHRILYFAIRYAALGPGTAAPSARRPPLEIAWTRHPLGLTMVMLPGRQRVLQGSRPPDNALHIYVVAKQWMSKLQHMEGRREINELHHPLGRPIQLTHDLEDVIPASNCRVSG